MNRKKEIIDRADLIAELSDVEGMILEVKRSDPADRDYRLQKLRVRREFLKKELSGRNVCRDCRREIPSKYFEKDEEPYEGPGNGFCQRCIHEAIDGPSLQKGVDYPDPWGDES